MTDVAGAAPRAYLLLVLSVGAVLSPLPHSVAALSLLILQAYLLYKPMKPGLNLAITFSTLLLAPLTLEPPAGKLLPAVLMVPALPLLDKALREDAAERPPAYLKDGRGLTAAAKALMVALLLTFTSSLALLNQALMLTSALIAAYLSSILLYVLIKVPRRPLAESKTWCRVVVGESAKTHASIRSGAAMPLRVSLKPLHGWAQLHPSRFTLPAGGGVDVSLTIRPPLACPSRVQLQASAVDAWGLTSTGQVLEPVELHVIPRARYAEWLARRFLEATGPGAGVTAEAPPLRAFSAGRLGLEYYGSRPYQAGDRLRDLDWKHTLKLGELIVKEYAGARGQPAIMVVNLAAGSPEEADGLAYAFIASALTLAAEGLQMALAAYDEGGVVESTPLMSPREALKEALKLTRKIAIVEAPKRVLEPPNLMRLRRSIEQLKALSSEPARRLAEILSFERGALEEAARSHPAGGAAEAVAEACPPPATVALISLWNHDAEALPVILERLERRGYVVVPIEVAAKPLKPRLSPAGGEGR
jgi:uncharacterized protein (DUF58 family)